MTIILLDDVRDIGETRREAVKKLYDLGYENIFMSDDTILDIIVNNIHVSKKSGKEYFGKKKDTNVLDALKIWEYYHNNYYYALEEDESEKGADFSCFGCYKGYEFSSSNINHPCKINQKFSVGNFVCLNIKKIIENNINYISVKFGPEDVYLPYMLLKAGMKIRSFMDLSCVIETYKNKEKTGGNNADKSISRIERLNNLHKTFITETLKRNYEDDMKDIGIVLRTKKSGERETSFIPKFWMEYYKNFKESKNDSRQL